MRTFWIASRGARAALAAAAVTLTLAVTVTVAATAGAAADDSRITAYRNPVLPGVHADPSAIRVGEWFYLVNSSFEMFPGVPVHRSRDLVHWNRSATC
jgi:beta-xylosidase